MSDLTQAEAKELFIYRDGHLIERTRRNSKSGPAGSRAGYVATSGYLLTQIAGKAHRVHRIIYIYHHGAIPDGMDIDHIDGAKWNNAIQNLRAVSRSRNILNQKHAHADSASGIIGVNASGNTWRARIKVGSKIVERRFKHLSDAIAFRNHLTNTLIEAHHE